MKQDLETILLPEQEFGFSLDLDYSYIKDGKEEDYFNDVLDNVLIHCDSKIANYRYVRIPWRAWQIFSLCLCGKHVCRIGIDSKNKDFKKYPLETRTRVAVIGSYDTNFGPKRIYAWKEDYGLTIK